MPKAKTNKPRNQQKSNSTPKKRSTHNNQTSMNFGDSTQINGNLNFASRDMITRTTVTGFNAIEVKQLFDQLQKDIETKAKTSSANKEDLKANVQEIKASVSKAVKNQKQLNEGFLERRFRNIARIAPDILDVVVATLTSPALGVGEMAKKIAAKAKEEIKS